MNNEKPRTFEPIKSKQVWTVLLFCLFGVFLSYHPIRCDFHYPPPSAIQPARQAEAVPQSEVKRIAVDMDRWSEWVRLPGGRRVTFRHPGCWYDLEFPDGSVRHYIDDGTPRNVGTLPSCDFRIRGTKGVVEIEIHPRR